MGLHLVGYQGQTREILLPRAGEARARAGAQVGKRTVEEAASRGDGCFQDISKGGDGCRGKGFWYHHMPPPKCAAIGQPGVPQPPEEDYARNHHARCGSHAQMELGFIIPHMRIDNRETVVDRGNERQDQGWQPATDNVLMAATWMCRERTGSNSAWESLQRQAASFARHMVRARTPWEVARPQAGPPGGEGPVLPHEANSSRLSQEG